MIVAYYRSPTGYEQFHIAYETCEGIVREWCNNTAEFNFDTDGEGVVKYKNFSEVRAYLKSQSMDILHDDGES